jgi:hypothetical protein
VIAAVGRSRVLVHLAVLIRFHAIEEFNAAAHGLKARAELEEIKRLIPSNPIVARLFDRRIQEEDTITPGDFFQESIARDDLSHCFDL